MGSTTPEVAGLGQRRPPDGARRCQLLDVAEEVFLEKGFHAATMDEIARRSGMSKKTIYQIVPGKNALLDLLMGERLAHFFARIEDDGAPMETVLIDFLCRTARIALAPRQVALGKLLIAESRLSALDLTFFQRGLRHGDGALEIWMRDQAKRGRLPVANPCEAAAMLFGMSIGEFLLGQLFKADPPPSEASICRRVESAVRIFLGGICRAGAESVV